MNLHAHYPTRQHGATLVVSLVMLIVLTLLVVSAMRSGNTNLRIAGNMQLQQEVIAAAQQATETIISSNFTVAPAATDIAVVIGRATYNATVASPVCSGSRALLNNEPNLPPECLSSSSAQNTGIVFASSPAATGGTSWCYAQQWEIQTTVNDADTGASTTLHQGVKLNVPAGTSC
ncbi:MAG: PilX N-terminal domain-containing pilus assembly protein [Gallionellaceae bacterium]|jgi:Tfp pilus assembly protein PilX